MKFLQKKKETKQVTVFSSETKKVLFPLPVRTKTLQMEKKFMQDINTSLAFASRSWYFFNISSFWFNRTCIFSIVWWAIFIAWWYSGSSSFLHNSAIIFSFSDTEGNRSLSSFIILSLDKTFCSAFHRAASFSFNFYNRKQLLHSQNSSAAKKELTF